MGADEGYYFKVIATGSGSYSGIVSSSVKGPVVAAGETIPIQRMNAEKRLDSK